MDRSAKIKIALKEIFENRMKFGAGGIIANLAKLDSEQELHYAKGHMAELEPGRFERKILQVCDEVYAEVLKQVLEEMYTLYKEGRRQDPYPYWRDVERVMLSLCGDERRIEGYFMGFVKQLNFGNFKEARCIHFDYQKAIHSWVGTYIQKSKFLGQSTPQERRELVIPDLAAMLGIDYRKKESPERIEGFDKRYRAICEAARRASEGLAVVDRLDDFLTSASKPRKQIVERWLEKVPVFVVEMSDLSLSCSALLGMRFALEGDVVIVAEKRKWKEDYFELYQWDILLYEDYKELQDRLAIALYDLFERHEFSGKPDVMI